MKRKMLPIREGYFLINDHDDFRILFKRENGNVIGFDEIFDDGYVIKNARDEH